MRPDRRILFLDDDTYRGVEFLARNSGAVWVETASDCKERLAESWDEVHLDHDLGGEIHVDRDRDDCGITVVRWLCDEFRPHLRDTRFLVHTHNTVAACTMVFHLRTMGYRVGERRFGAPPAPAGGRKTGLFSWLEKLLARSLMR